MKRAARRAGLELTRYNPVNSFDRQRALMMRHVGIDLVLDVGGSVGDYARELRADGFRGQIVSFEPLAASFELLSAAADRDPGWTAVHTALSDASGSAEIHVAGNASSSSLLPMDERHLIAAPKSRYVATEAVPLARLDDLEAGASDAQSVMLKLDVQGAEDKVLGGAPRTIERCQLVEVELSLVPLYTGGPLFEDMLLLLGNLGFELAAVRTALADPASGRALQLDGLFVRR
jgi:FkbM family methyltransferase